MDNEKILVIDGNCSFCRKVGESLESSYVVKPLDDKNVKEFSKEVLGEELTDMMLIDGGNNKVYIGEEAFNKIISEKSNKNISNVVDSIYSPLRKLLDMKENRKSTERDEIVSIESGKIEEYF